MNNLVSTLNPKSIPYKLNDDWIWYKWEDIIEYYQQGLIRSNSELDSEYGIDYFKMSFINQDGSYSFNKLPKTKATDKEIKDYRINSGDFFINVRNSKELVGKSCVIYRVDKDILFNHMLVRIKQKQHITGSYINAYFNTDFGKKLLDTCKKGTTTVIALYQKDLYDLPIPIPNEDILKQIDSTYNSINQKIEINNRINAELEELAKKVYDYWFVQFDFPFDFAQGKPNAEGKPYKSSGGKMVWSEDLKREIPEGWKGGELKDIANITMGQSPAGESYNEDGNGMVFYQGCTDFGTRFPSIRKYTTEPTRFARKGDILLSVRAPVGTLNIAKEDCCIGRGLAALNSKDNCIAYLFGVMVNLKQIFDRRNTDGTTFGSITKDDLFTLKVIKPSNEVLEMYHKLINPCFEKQNLIAEENQQLSSLRDWLLPMLMNGQVVSTTLNNWEQEMEVERMMAAEPSVEYGKK